jgi:anti-sigma-K factor RskA
MPEPDRDSPHVDLGGYLLGTLSAAEREAFASHLTTCAECRRELEELGGLPALLDQGGEPVDVPPGLESRVMAAIAREPDRRPAAAPVLEMRRRPTRPWPLGWAAAAAAAVLLAFAGGLGLGRGLPAGAPPGPAPAAQTIHLVAANGGTGSGVAEVRSTRGGKTIELTVRGLPPPPAGHFYTCWLVADDDTLQHQDRVSVGSFVTPDSGSVTLRWETAADLGRYPHLGVTLEPDNGVPLHQGPRVLASS